MAAAVDQTQLAAELMEIDRFPPLVAEHVPRDAELDAVLGPLEDAECHELLRVRIGDIRVLVAVELAVDGSVADLVAGVGERHLEAGVETFVEAEVAAVARLIVRALETLHAAEDGELLPLRQADANRVARLVVAVSQAKHVVGIAAFTAAAGFACAADFAAAAATAAGFANAATATSATIAAAAIGTDWLAFVVREVQPFAVFDFSAVAFCHAMIWRDRSRLGRF